MTRSQIQIRAQQLTAQGPYYQMAFRAQPEKLQSSTVAERVALASADAAFCLHVAQSHALRAEPLPDLDWPGAVLRAYRRLREPNFVDADIELVWQLNQPEKTFQRDVLRSTLICWDNTLQDLARRLGLRLATINDFEILTWNCRDRRDERVYLARLCRIPGFGFGLGQAWVPETDEFGLLQRAYREGRTEAVLAAAELVPAQTLGSSTSPEQRIFDSILGSVLERLKLGKVAKEDNPLLEPVLSHIAGQLKEKPVRPETGAPGPTQIEAIKATFGEALVQPQPTPDAVVLPTASIGQ